MYGCESFSLEITSTTPSANRVDVCSAAFHQERSSLHSAPTEPVLACQARSQVHSVEQGVRSLAH